MLRYRLLFCCFSRCCFRLYLSFSSQNGCGIFCVFVLCCVAVVRAPFGDSILFYYRHTIRSTSRFWWWRARYLLSFVQANISFSSFQWLYDSLCRFGVVLRCVHLWRFNFYSIFCTVELHTRSVPRSSGFGVGARAKYKVYFPSTKAV